MPIFSLIFSCNKLFIPTFAGATVEVFSDEKKKFFFQNQHIMKDAFQAYPELLCLDATYKLLELGLPVYLMLCEDSNGMSEIVCVCLLVSEDTNSITWMMEALKQHNAHAMGANPCCHGR